MAGSGTALAISTAAMLVLPNEPLGGVPFTAKHPNAPLVPVYNLDSLLLYRLTGHCPLTLRPKLAELPSAWLGRDHFCRLTNGTNAIELGSMDSSWNEPARVLSSRRLIGVIFSPGLH